MSGRKKLGRPPGNGVSRPVQRSRVKLAMVLRDEFPAELISEFYKLILMGKIPEIVEDARATKTGGKKVVERTGAYTPPTLDQRMQVVARILERTDGMPAQHVHLEAEIQAETKLLVGLPTVKELPPDLVDALRKALRGDGSPQKRLATPEPDFADLDVVDADFETLPVDLGKGSK
jgi:hypothetical protein